MKLKIKHVVTSWVYTSHGIKISTFKKKKKNQGMRLKLSSAPLMTLIRSFASLTYVKEQRLYCFKW